MSASRWGRSALLGRLSFLLVAVGGLTASTALLGPGGCSIDRELVNNPPPYYMCYTDADCLEGYVCREATDTEPGFCGGSEGPGDCVDEDGDTYFVGEGCGAGLVLDCNDDEPLIHPGADEQCNGIDDNCNDDVDEGVPDQNCPLQNGVCAGARQACVNGAWQDCIAEGLYGSNFENVLDPDESCDGLDNNCSGGYPADATPEEIDAQCDCIPGYTPPTACGTDTGECERGVKFCLDDGSFTECALADLGDTCTDDGDCPENGFCVDEEIDFREDFLDGCQLGSEPACERRVCRVLTGTATCATDAACGVDEVCLEDACQLLVQRDVPESCNGRDDDCNGRIDESGVCPVCPFGMVLIEGVPGIPNRICMDRFEASRSDATASDEGANELYAVSRENVLPWTGVDASEADAACRGTAMNGMLTGAVPARTLCLQAPQLAFACDGNQGTYPYGSSFMQGICNDSSTGTDLAPTGSYTGCCVQVGATADDTICDLSGNAAEVVSSPFAGVFGGSTATVDPDELSCTVSDIDGLDSSYQGFRCCVAPSD